MLEEKFLELLFPDPIAHPGLPNDSLLIAARLITG
jgi:hypothetical protein